MIDINKCLRCSERWPGTGRTVDLPIFRFQVHPVGVGLPGILLAVVTPSRRQKRTEDWSYWTVDWTPRLNTEISSTLHAVLRAQFAPQVMGWRDSNIIFGAQMNPAGQQPAGAQRRLGPTPTHASGRGLAGASDRAGCR
jgi:hypothetical protein